MSVRRMAAALAAAVVALPLAGCAGDAVGTARGIYDAVVGLGVDCAEPDVADQNGLPYQSIGCVGVRIDWADDADAYADLVRADCEATPASARGSLDRTVVVVGPQWVLRGTDPDEPDGWPRDLTPEQAAAGLDGTAMSAAAYCRQVGAWA